MTKTPLVSAFVLLLSAVPTWPCGFHNYVPQPTMVEHMLSSSSIALAHQSSVSPFKFEIVELLRGPSPASKIPFLVDTTTRKKLKSPELSVLFTYEQETQTWQRLAMVDEDLRPLLEDILIHLPEWRLGGDAQRGQMFAQLLDHPSPVVQNLALRELDRLDYNILRELFLFIDAQAMLADIGDPAQSTLASIRVLLLGLGRDQSLATELLQGLDLNRVGAGPVLGAYATALIELQGPAAVETLTRQYLSDDGYSKAARELLIEALALHSSYGSPEVIRAIQSALSGAIARDPDLAVPVARQFMSRYDWSMHQAISDVSGQLATVVSQEDLAVLDHYVLVSGGEIGLQLDN